jgi:outer membrane protein assembly factor BamB
MLKCAAASVDRRMTGPPPLPQMRRLRSLTILATLALTALLAVPATGSAAYDESTAFQVTPGHTGFASGGSLDRPPLRARWTRALGTSAGYPLIAAGRVFVVAYTEGYGATLYALDAGSGTTLWARSIAGYGELAYDAGRVYIAEASGAVLAVSASSGATLWIRDFDESFSLHKPVADGGVLYFVSAWSGGSIRALDGASGETLWSSQFSYGGNPGLDGSFVYASDRYEGVTVGLARADGQTSWWGSKNCVVASGNVVASGAHVIGPYNSSCGTVVDAGSGRQLDSISSNLPPAIAGDVAATISGGMLQARSLATGLLLWQYRADGGLRTSPVIVNETVYAGSTSGTLFAVDLRTGEPLWNGVLGPSGSVPGAEGMAAAGGLLVAPTSGSVVALESAAAPRPGLDLRITAGPDGPTNSRSASLTFGSSSPLALMTCRFDAGPWLPCLGSATFGALADGPHTFEVRTHALDGSVIALAARGWSVDTSVPAAIITDGQSGVTTISYSTFYLSADDRRARVECRLDGSPWRTCDTSSTGESVNVDDGPHEFEARARDAVGNVQATPVSRRWTVDTTAPHTQITAGPQGATESTAATFEFSADEPATFRCSMDYAWPAPCRSPFVMSGVSDGTHRFNVVAVDAAGNGDYYGATRVWTVGAPPPDTQAPDTVLYDRPPTVTAATSARFSFAADEPESSFQCSLDAAAWSECFVPADVAGLSDGEHVFAVRAVDGSGNIDPSPAAWRWTVDTRAPQARAALDQGSGPQAGYRFTFDADEPAATFECGLDAASWAPCSSGVAYDAVGAGEHEFRVRATDTAGNRAPQGTAVAFTVAGTVGETTPPAQTAPPQEPPPTPPQEISAPDEAPADPTSEPTPPAATTAPAATTPSATTTAPAITTAPAAPAAGAARAATAVATTRQITIEPAECARMLAADGVAILRSSTRRALRRGPKLKLYVFRPGHTALTITLRRHGRIVTVARAEARFAAAGARTVRLRFTAAGRRALAGQAKLTLRVRATVTPDHARPAAATRVARV